MTPPFLKKPFIRLCLTLLAIIVCSVSVYIYVRHSYTFAPSQNKVLIRKETWDASAEKRQWTLRIAAVGPEKAYAEFVEAYRNGPEISHIAMHLMGGLLYEALGISAIAVCDSSFGFACYHQYDLQAFAEHGIGAVTDIGNICYQRFGDDAAPCTHGIGHGLMEYFGPHRIVDALQTCSKLDIYPNTTDSCLSGVFMEYLVPVIYTDEGAEMSAQPLNSSKPYEFCEAAAVPDQFKTYCYHALPAWWWRGVKMEFAEITRLCLAAPSQHQQTCIIGMTYEILGSNKFDPAAAKKECAQLTTGEAQVWCLKGLAAFSNVTETIQPQ